MTAERELTGKGTEMFRKAWEQAHLEQLQKKIDKAIRRSTEDHEWVSIRVYGAGDTLRLVNRGWEVVATPSLGRGAGAAEVILRKKRSQIVLDNRLVEVV